MKKLVIGLTGCLLASLMLVGNVFGITQVFTVGAGQAWNATNLISVSTRIRAIRIDTVAGGATNLTFAFNDFPGFNPTNGWGNIKLTNGGYMQESSYVTNIAKLITNFSGVVTTNTITNALWTFTNFVGQTSNDWRVVASGSGGSNGTTTTLTIPSSGVNVVFGLGFTNNNIGVGATITITHDPAL